MLATAIRLLFTYLLTRRGKRTLAFVGTMLLCFLAAWLIDLRLYLTAAFIGVLAAVALFVFLMQIFRLRKDKRERERKGIEKAERRATTAEARSEKINKAKVAVAEAAKGVGSKAAGFVGATTTGVRGVGKRLSFWRRKNRTE
jgi:asparagine N-glycosylation enzyme membrane subunit Stt3